MTDVSDLCRDIQMKLPDDIWMHDELTRYTLGARYTQDFAALGDRRFIFGVITVPLSYAEDEFTWGCWVEVSPEDHDRYLAAFRSDLANELRFEGTLANEIPSYSESLGARVTVSCFEDRRPVFEVDPDTDLGTEQCEGLTAEAHRELDAILFGDDEEDEDELENDFKGE